MAVEPRDGDGTYDMVLRDLGQALTALKRQRGAPSYDRIRTRGEKLLGPSSALSKASMSEIFAGRRGPASLDRLLWLVRVLLSYDDGEETDPPERRDPRLQPWRERWNTLEARRAATRRRPQPAQPPLRPSREDYQQVALVLATLHQRLGSRTVTAMKQLQRRREERRDESANAVHKEPSPGDPLALMQRYGPLGTHKGTRSHKSRRSEAREEVLAVYVGIMLVVLLVAGVVRLVQ